MSDLDWDDFFAPIDPDLVVECNSTMDGRYDAVCVYRHLIVIESPDEPGGRTDLPTDEILTWSVLVDGDTLVATLVADRPHVARLPRSFSSALVAGLTLVLGAPSTLV